MGFKTRRSRVACAAVCAALSSLEIVSPAWAFREDFNGNSLDPNVWVIEAGTGEVVVSDGRITLSSSGSVFPVVTSRNDPFPPGDFRLRVGMQYHQVQWCGCGFGAMENFWESYAGQAVCRPFLLWQDSGGHYVYTGSVGATLLAAPPQTDYHLYEWVYSGGAYAFSMDGVERANGSCAPRATRIFFGHPHPISCPIWTSFSIDFIEVTPLHSTRGASSTWGDLKIRYQ